ncbi:MAG: response regulator [Candidatus Solibacter usitatus]|nr:response regulator [Candidatus Solibacter usitatus]
MMDRASLAESLLQNADDIVYVVLVGSNWHNGVAELVSEKVKETLGYEPREFTDDPELWFKTLHPQDRELLVKTTMEIIASGKPGTRVFRMRHKHTQEYRWIEDKYIPQLDADGKVTRILGFARDITERMAGEKARQNEAMLQALFDSTPDALLASDGAGLILRANGHAESMFGYTHEELAGQPLEMLLPERFRETHAAHRQGYNRNPTSRSMGTGMELIARRKDASEIPVDIMLNATTIDGKMVVVSVIRDITARKHMEAERSELQHQLLQAQKMEAIGRLAGGIAHDFNNLLMVINGHSDLLLKKTYADDPALEPLTEIKKAGLRAAALTQHLLAFSRKQVQQKKVLDLNQFVLDANNMMRRVVPENVRMDSDLASGLGQIAADPSHIDQVIMNLVVNACDAMPNGGRIRFSTRNVDLDAESLREHPDVPPGPFVEMVMRDSGTGIDPEVLPHIFEPFYTTKAEGVGTGLGLSTVFGVVKQAGGLIKVDSELGVGTAFSIYLPRLAERVEQEDAPALLDISHGRGELILLVEDQPEVLSLVCQMLEDGGYAVLPAQDPAEALRIAGEHGEKIHLLLTDVVMPGMSGPDLAQEILRERPNMKTLFMSGYTRDHYPADSVMAAGSGFLQKPVSAAALTAKVREILGPPQRPRIVVVDDEPSVRSVVSRILESAGYEVLSFDNGKLAVEELERNEIDLLLTDLVMPKQEGIETIRQVRQRWPRMKVIAMSGAFGGRYLNIAAKLGAHETIAKPFLPDQLIQAVQDTLKRR